MPSTVSADASFGTTSPELDMRPPGGILRGCTVSKRPPGGILRGCVVSKRPPGAILRGCVISRV